MTEEPKVVRVQTLDEREGGVPVSGRDGAAVTLPAGAEPECKVVPNLVGQTLVLVGNGPGSPEHKDFIDRFDAVARIQGFPMGDSGDKWDIWTGCYGAAAEFNIRKFGNHKAPGRPRLVWCAGDNHRRADALGVTRNAVVSILSGNTRERVRNAVGSDPTSGFMSIEMALRAEPRELVLVGFDATIPAEPGWDHWESDQGFPPVQTDKPNVPGTGHDMAREKALLLHWVKTREFCGKKFPKTRPRWWRMQEVGQMGALAGKRVCLVGNGPSAYLPENVEKIDACDIVVRINAFPVGESGKKWDAWWCAPVGVGNAYCEKEGVYRHEARPDWIWGVAHLDASKFPFIPKSISRIESDRIQHIVFVTNQLSKVERGRHPVTGRKRPIQATSGIFALDLALSMAPKELILVGFDAYSQDKPGWEHGGSKPCAWSPEKVSVSGGKHDYLVEKQMIEKWVADREFYGSLYPHTQPVWWKLKK